MSRIVTPPLETSTIPSPAKYFSIRDTTSRAEPIYRAICPCVSAMLSEPILADSVHPAGAGILGSGAFRDNAHSSDFGAAASGSPDLPQTVPPAACTPAFLPKAGCSVSVFFLTGPFSTHFPAVISRRRYNHTSGNAAWYVPYPLYDKRPTTGRCSAKWGRQTAPSP